MTVIALVLILKESYNLDFSFSNQGFINFIDLFNPYKNLLTATFVIIPVYIGLESLISNINNQEGKSLLELRNLLNEPENLEIHKKLRGDTGDWANGIPANEKENDETWRKIDNYLGIFELLNILIEKNIISKNNFDTQFGYRVDNVSQNLDIVEYIKNYEDSEIIWKELLSLFKKRN